MKSVFFLLLVVFSAPPAFAITPCAEISYRVDGGKSFIVPALQFEGSTIEVSRLSSTQLSYQVKSSKGSEYRFTLKDSDVGCLFQPEFSEDEETMAIPFSISLPNANGQCIAPKNPPFTYTGVDVDQFIEGGLCIVAMSGNPFLNALNSQFWIPEKSQK